MNGYLSRVLALLAVLGLVAVQPVLGQNSGESGSESLNAPRDGNAADVSPPTDAIVPGGDEVVQAHGDSVAPVILLGRELFQVPGISLVGAKTRAADMSDAIREVADSFRYRPEDLRILRDDRVRAYLIVCGSHFVAAAWDDETVGMATTSKALAEERMEIIRQAIIDYRHDFSAPSLIKGGIHAIVSIGLLLVTLKLLFWLRRRAEGYLQRKLRGRTLLTILTGDAVVTYVSALNRLILFVVVIWLSLLTVNFILSRFPWTYGIAAQIFDLAARPLRTFGDAFVEHIPSLFFLGFIIVITILVLRPVRFFFSEIERGRIAIAGFHVDWARPTYNIIRILVIVAAVVAAFPYIPGSSSPAFKGMSIFLGVLVSLGSSSAVANIVAGIILIYMRPFVVGDRVQIGETVGDVIDRNLLTTRVRTTKNECVTIPNTGILSGQIINFTSLGQTDKLIVHSTVTIGYDVPWRTVHELLTAAAEATEGILPYPKPFVLQKGLHDFYIEYEVNGYTDKPEMLVATYSKLHQNIQDRFQDAGVEILSPHYRALRSDAEHGEPAERPNSL